MKLFHKINELQAFLSPLRAKKLKVGFVPTMGALHNGHISLIQKAAENCDVVVCSIFVNPLQFNEKIDFESYPRHFEDDIEILSHTACDALFLPGEQEVYPNGKPPGYDFGPIMNVLEGRQRPGHFSGMVTVVKRLFEIVQPDMAFFGQKDYQQLLIVKEMVKRFEMPVKIVGCPIVRTEAGLAISSRNTLLSEKQKEDALVLYQTLSACRKRYQEGQPINEIESKAVKDLESHDFLKLEYFEIVDGNDLQHHKFNIPVRDPIALVAARFGSVRLIDNMPLNQ